MLILGLNGLMGTSILLLQYNMSKPDKFYESCPQKRTFRRTENMLPVETRQKELCCINPPLLNIPFDHVILDELHLFLRVTDVLTRNVLDEMIELVDEESHKRKVANPSVIWQHLQTAVEAINKLKLFCSMGHKHSGYGKKNVTCYMYSVVYHVPEAMKKHSNVKQFMGQGVEKNNDDAR
ncbi:unnamed protein product [Porites evermanni]|uniref:Helicase ATP-binding domain-containing protein n=1 Tax=Porites evermanni TaxID=104178 RepID=A0ABN8Q7V1_9CNID|nr:unnamed protein product [Porites evermanni]